MIVTRTTSVTRRVLPGLFLLLAAGLASAEKLAMPRGMGGVPDIGAIPCSVINEMMVVAPLGTRHSLVTWSAGYLNALTGKTLQEVTDSAGATGGAWTYARLADDLVAYCTANPKAVTRDAVVKLAKDLGTP